MSFQTNLIQVGPAMAQMADLGSSPPDSNEITSQKLIFSYYSDDKRSQPNVNAFGRSVLN